MSLERLSHSLGGFQIRHHVLGVYQGSAIELAFWHPSSGMPEYGLCRFSTQDKAQAMIEFLTSQACAEPLNRQELTIESYDLDEHERLTTDYPLPSAWEQPT